MSFNVYTNMERPTNKLGTVNANPASQPQPWPYVVRPLLTGV